jgi:quinol monooxygenase YgiN
LAVAVLLVSVAVAGTLAYRAQAQQAAPAAAPAPVQPPGPVHVVTFVDITPNNRVPGTDLSKQYVADTRRAAGIVRVDVLAQTNRPNHLVVYEIWQNLAAFDAHEAAPTTKDFRAKMLPMLGSPFDQRLHYVVP